MPATRRRADRADAAPAARLAVALALGVAAIAIVVRVAPQWAEVIEGGVALIRDPDACYHLRRAALMVGNFPDLALFDSYVNFPYGAHVIWPPFYDLALALLTALFPSAGPGPSAAVALLPPLTFGLTVIVMFLLARRLRPRDPWSAALAALVVAVLPASLPYTAIAQLDHHAAELLMIALFLLTLGDALSATEATPLRRALWPALVLAGALGMQLSLVILVGLAAAVLVGVPGSGRRARFELGAWIFGLAFALLLPWGLLYAAAGAPLRHYQFGLFQPGVLLAAALASCCALMLAPSPAPRRRMRLLGAALAALALVWVVSALAGEAIGAVSYLTRSYSSWQQDIGESRPLWADGWRRAASLAFGALSPLVLLLPLAWLRLARDASAGDSRRGVILAASLLFAALAILQQRFLPHLALVLGVAAVAAVEAQLRPARGAARRGVVLAALALLACAPLLGAKRSIDPAARAFDESRSTLAYLAEQTPPTSHYDDPTATPEYGVLAEWSYGHFIQYHGRRPALVDNFGHAAGDPAGVRSLLLAEEEQEALAAFDSLRVRYVLLRDLPSTFEGLLPDGAIRRRFVAGAELSGAQGVVRFTPAMTRTLLYRLAWRNGGGVAGDSAMAAPPLARLRLVAESEELDEAPGGAPLARVKLFEVVEGARLAVEGCEAGEEAILLATVRSPRGRRFPYLRSLQAGRDGALRVTLPYPTAAAADRSRIESGSIKTRGGDIALPAVSEDDVRLGREVRAALPTPASR